MNKRLLSAIALLAIIVALIFSFAPEPVQPIKVGDQIKPFQLPDLSGELKGVPQGKVVLLNFWATWCPPCRKEVPSMVKLYASLKDQGVEIVAVSVDKRVDDVKAFVQEQHMDFTVLHDVDSTVARQYAVFRYPETFIIDRNGVVRQHLNGAVEWTDPEFMTYIEELLAESVAK